MQYTCEKFWLLWEFLIVVRILWLLSDFWIVIRTFWFLSEFSVRCQNFLMGKCLILVRIFGLLPEFSTKSWETAKPENSDSWLFFSLGALFWHFLFEEISVSLTLHVWKCFLSGLSGNNQKILIVATTPRCFATQTPQKFLTTIRQQLQQSGNSDSK